jgi:hypothetical protein
MATQPSSIKSFSDFVTELKGALAKDFGQGNVHQDFRQLIVTGAHGGAPASISLDKVYRFYIDHAVKNPKVSSGDLLEAAKSFVNNYRKNIGEKPLFSVGKVVSAGPVVLEQCCIR